MAMTKCKECGGQVSTAAESCPHCGAKRAKTYGCGSLIIASVAVLLLLTWCMPSRDVPPSPSATAPQQAVVPPQPKDPAVELAEQSQSVDQIEQRLKDNTEHLKRYYAKPEQIRQANGDLLSLAVIKAAYSDSEDRDRKALSQRAGRLIPRIEQQARELYASSLAEIFVKSGMDVEVSARGTDKKRLRISYALMSQPLVYKFQNEIKIQSQAQPLGFTQIVYTNGFDSSMGRTWTVDLSGASP